MSQRRGSRLLGLLVIGVAFAVAVYLVNQKPGPGKPSTGLVATPVPASPEPAIKGRLALVLDDWGYHTHVLPELVAFPGAVTVAVLPGLPFSQQVATAASERGHQVILHLPMQAHGNVKREKGTLMAGMGANEARALLTQHWLSVPGAKGLNNHEGSKATEDPRLMAVVAEFLREKQAFFLDSLTSARSQGKNAARGAGIPFVARRVFLDNVDDALAIEKEARVAMRLAIKNGSCVAIGHPRPNTLRVLIRMAPEFAANGVRLVPVSDLAKLVTP